MKLIKTSKSSIFLLEIIINILLFSILLCISMNFFMKSHRLTKETTYLYQAVTACSNVANVYETGDGSLESILNEYPYSVNMDYQVIIYLDESLNECTSQDAFFCLTVALLPEDESCIRRNQANIICYQGEDTIYSIIVSQYTPLTPSIAKEVL